MFKHTLQIETKFKKAKKPSLRKLQNSMRRIEPNTPAEDQSSCISFKDLKMLEKITNVFSKL